MPAASHVTHNPLGSLALPRVHLCSLWPLAHIRSHTQKCHFYQSDLSSDKRVVVCFLILQTKQHFVLFFCLHSEARMNKRDTVSPTLRCQSLLWAHECIISQQSAVWAALTREMQRSVSLMCSNTCFMLLTFIFLLVGTSETKNFVFILNSNTQFRIISIID